MKISHRRVNQNINHNNCHNNINNNNHPINNNQNNVQYEITIEKLNQKLKVEDEIKNVLKILNEKTKTKINTLFNIKHIIKEFFRNYFKDIENKINEEKENLEFFITKNYKDEFTEKENVDYDDFDYKLKSYHHKSKKLINEILNQKRLDDIADNVKTECIIKELNDSINSKSIIDEKQLKIFKNDDNNTLLNKRTNKNINSSVKLINKDNDDNVVEINTNTVDLPEDENVNIIHTNY